LGPTHRTGGKRQGPTGPLVGRLGAGAASEGPYLGDLGFEGKEWQRHWRADYGATVVTQADYRPEPTPEDQAKPKRWLSGKRQQLETELGWLDSRVGLKYPRARTPGDC
ncbi:MAG: hypothetical protein ACR2PL_08845, partial [Dehalococcoidia bacterium]